MTEEVKSHENTEAAIKSPPELAQADEAPPVQDAEQPSQGEFDEVPKRNRHITRLVVVFVLIGLIVVVYIKRDSLLKADSQSNSSGDQAAPAKAELKVLYWQDPMHPAYTSDKPGKAPDCGMDLVPIYENAAGAASNLPEGAFPISSEKQQLIGVTYSEVSYGQMSKTLRAVARLAYDETKTVRIHPKVEGWIEDVYVDFIGKKVQKGQPLISIYSPDLVSTQQEYLLAIKGRTELSESPFKEAATGSQSLYEAARRRLELFDITDQQIKDLEKRGSPIKALTIYAPTNGFVLVRNAYPKQRVTPETELYQIADLSTVWAIADIYEYEAPEIKIGQSATMTLSYYPGKPFRGVVSYISPQVDAATRTLKVRIEFPNPDFTLKPDMFANVELKIDYGKRLVVPQEAVLDSGSDQTVFVSLEGGYFEARKVQLGGRVDNKVIVLAGLKPGERIVTSANFLIDSESKLKSAAAGLGMPGMSHGGGAPAGAKPAQTNQSQRQQGGQPKAAPQPPEEDHSKHQVKPKAQPQVEDHSKRQLKPKAEPQVEDHSKHKPPAEDQSQLQVKPVEHSQPEMTKEAADISKREAKPERKALYWYDPMHPKYTSDKPGKAPDCGMDLVPKYADGK
ncbi:MAG: efflux RND transporter periplasmic adaptor subunit [Acidobacteriota bacterium]